MKLTAYTGRPKPCVAVGEHQVRLLGFAELYRGWHYVGKDRASQRAIQGLVRRGCIEVNEDKYRFNQAKETK